MKFALAAALVAAPAVFAHLPSVHHARHAAPVQARDTLDSQTCIDAVKSMGEYYIYDASCVNLIYSCLGAANKTEEIWTDASCVAAATCDGTRNLLTLAQCENPAVNATDSGFLAYEIYASIVGDCAYDEDGCSMTQQNYVDFFYSTLSSINSTEWPANVTDIVDNYWSPIVDWAAVGDEIPYRNFADWLVYSDSFADSDCDAEDTDA